MSECQSFSKDYRWRSQPRKISVGVLVDSISKEKNVKDAVTQVAENGTSSKGHCVEKCGGHTPLLEKNGAIPQKVASPWFSTRCLGSKTSSKVAVYDAEPTPSYHAPRRTCSRLHHLEKASAANLPKFSARKTGLERNEHREKYLFKASHFMDAGKVYNEEHVEITALEREQTQVRDNKIETAGNETLRTKLWEILGNVSSPNKHCSNSQSLKLYQDEDGDGKHCLAEERKLNFDKGASDSKRHSFRRTSHSLTQKNICTRNQGNRIEASKSTCHSKVSPLKKIFLFKEDCSGRLHDNLMEGSLTSKRNKIEIQGSEMGTHQGCNNDNAEEKQHSENKSRSIPTIAKSVVHRNELNNANSSYDKKIDVFNEAKSGEKNDSSIQFIQTVTKEKQKDVVQLVDVDITNSKDKQEDSADSLLKNNGICMQDPFTLSFEIKSPECLTKIKQGKPHGRSPDKTTITKGIRSFKSLLSSRSAEGQADAQSEPSDGSCSHHMKPSCTMESNTENQMSSPSTNSMHTGNLRNDLDTKGCKVSGNLSPEVCLDQKIRHGPDKNLNKEKEVKMTGCNLESKLFKETVHTSEFQIYLEQNHEDGFASAVAMLNVALHHIKAKLKSVSNKRSAEILWAAAEEIFLIFQRAESQINTDVGRLIKFSQSKRKRLENKFQAQQEQLLGIYKRFKDEVNRHVQDYGDITEDLEEHAIELERNLERQRAAHKKLISQVEQEIKVQLDDAEERILAVHELANKKVRQMKLVVAESVKHVAFG